MGVEPSNTGRRRAKGGTRGRPVSYLHIVCCVPLTLGGRQSPDVGVEPSNAGRRRTKGGTRGRPVCLCI